MTAKDAKGFKLKPILVVLAVLLALAAGAIGWGWADLMGYAQQPAASEAEPQVFQVRSGVGLKTIARQLAQAGLIRQPIKFQILARLEKVERRLQAGEYLLAADQSPRQILAALSDGRVRLHKVTIPEGYTQTQIVQLMVASGLAGAANFAGELKKPQYIEQLGIPGTSLEGYLFPDTYLFPRQALAPEMVRALLSRFGAVFNQTWRTRAEALGFSVHEIVTLASIIEKETGQPRERPLIASVFHNRLNAKMRLMSDPTVIYGIPDFDGNLTRRHLRTATPYNTYTQPGLPPGPIANPGREALQAALYPAESDYLYFVAKNDGSHQFSIRYKDHLKAVRTYQLGQ
ncbi:MAG: endolytic transglycosylase MltG [Desulfobacterales bacterium]